MKSFDVNLVSDEYTSDDCIQFMEPYTGDYISIFGDRLLYHSSIIEADPYNDYLNDSRRFDFPYFNIPSHVEKSFFGKVNYVNQLYDFGKNYVIAKDGDVIGRTQFKLGSGECVTISELLKPVFTENKSNNDCYDVYTLIDQVIPDDAAIITKCGIICDKKGAFESFLRIGDVSLVYVSTSLEGAVASGIRIYKDSDKYGVILFDYPFSGLNKNNVESFREIATEINDPVIKRRHNPNIEKRDIISAKTMARYKK